MENQNQNTEIGQKTINIQVPSVENIASKRPLIPALFVVVIVFFFFNFFTVKCGSQEIGSVSGINLVTGTELKNHDMITGGETRGEKIPSNAWAIIALFSAIVGLGAFLIKEKREAIIGTVAGITGFGSLIILQFVIKSEITQKGNGQIEVSFQFWYWVALLAMGIAGFLSYLRMKKNHTIIVSVTNTSISTPISTEINPILETKVNPNVPTTNFNIVEWLSKNVKIVIIVVGGFIILFGFYYFFLKNDPGKDGQNIASSMCECGKKQNEQMIDCYRKYIADFDSYKFSGRQEARKKLESLVQSINSLAQQCYDANQEKLAKRKERYISDKEQVDKFEYAFNAQQGICNNNSNELNSLNSEVTNKINEYIGPVEKEQARQDSIAAAKAAEIAVQADIAFSNATKNIPSINQMKQDLLGKELRNINGGNLSNEAGYWTFEVGEIRSFKITGNSFDKNTRTYKGNIEMVLYGLGTGRFHSNAIIEYTWDVNSNTWNFKNIFSQEFHR